MSHVTIEIIDPSAVDKFLHSLQKMLNIQATLIGFNDIPLSVGPGGFSLVNDSGFGTGWCTCLLQNLPRYG